MQVGEGCYFLCRDRSVIFMRAVESFSFFFGWMSVSSCSVASFRMTECM